MPFIEGYLNTLSVPQGGALQLHASGNGTGCSLRIVREGDPETVMHEESSLDIGAHPVPIHAWSEGAGWPVCWEFTVPAAWPSGVYRLELLAEGDADQDNHTQYGWRRGGHDVLFVVRAARPASQYKILLQLCTNTYMAYNPWGGKSTYAYNSTDNVQAPQVSLLRPGHGYYGGSGFGGWERQFVQWCDREGIGLEYAINYDLETWPDGFDDYRLILSVGHDEYWSGPMRDNLERFIANGGNAAFFSGNSVCWQVRFEDEGRTMVAYKEYYKDDPLYQSGDYANVSTLFSHPVVGRPENRLTGVGFPMGGYHRSHGAYMDGSGAYTVRRADHWVFEGTGLNEGNTFGGADTIVGYECDGCAYEEVDGYPVPTHDDGTPDSFTILAQAPAVWTGLDDRSVYGESGVSPDGRATLGVYTQGGTVFTAGTTDWSHGLKNDAVVQRITRNVMNRLGS